MEIYSIRPLKHRLLECETTFQSRSLFSKNLLLSDGSHLTLIKAAQPLFFHFSASHFGGLCCILSLYAQRFNKQVRNSNLATWTTTQILCKKDNTSPSCGSKAVLSICRYVFNLAYYKNTLLSTPNQKVQVEYEDIFYLHVHTENWKGNYAY